MAAWQDLGLGWEILKRFESHRAKDSLICSWTSSASTLSVFHANTPLPSPQPPLAFQSMSLHLLLPLSFTHLLFFWHLLTSRSVRPGRWASMGVSQTPGIWEGPLGECWGVLHHPLRPLVALAGVCAPHKVKWWLYRGNRDSPSHWCFFISWPEYEAKTQSYMGSRLCLVHS